MRPFVLSPQDSSEACLRVLVTGSTGQQALRCTLSDRHRHRMQETESSPDCRPEVQGVTCIEHLLYARPWLGRQGGPSAAFPELPLESEPRSLVSTSGPLHLSPQRGLFSPYNHHQGCESPTDVPAAWNCAGMCPRSRTGQGQAEMMRMWGWSAARAQPPGQGSLSLKTTTFHVWEHEGSQLLPGGVSVVLDACACSQPGSRLLLGGGEGREEEGSLDPSSPEPSWLLYPQLDRTLVRGQDLPGCQASKALPT